MVKTFHDMQPEELNAEIIDLEANLVRLGGEIRTGPREVLSEWIWQTTETIVKASAENTKALGKEKLGELKTLLRELEEQVPKVIDSSLDEDSLRKKWRVETPSFESSPQIRPTVESVLEKATLPLSPLLSKFNYRPQWRKFQLSKPLLILIDEFEKSARSWCYCMHQNNVLVERKNQQEASDLWDEA